MISPYLIFSLINYYKVTIIAFGILFYCIWLYKLGKRTNLEIVQNCLGHLDSVIRKYYIDYDGKIIQ